jgi:hypothetical protein
MNLSREFWMAVRQAILAILDALERELQTERRTAEVAKENKELRRQTNAQVRFVVSEAHQ